ncbi:Meiotically up-regulated gene 71 protein [Papilio machaon]|uniref:Meiotically up-regulated gene 71 protein n=1 Tax=Papilio machaon TaxID=76193 RepID=A0A0N1PKJ8_PAPMA|nr:Meiotically up-regulated gene 71 protein [Papilio machaon]
MKEAVLNEQVAHKEDVNQSQEADGSCKERVTMHVQGISHWAPANIGPYSQAVKVGEVVSTSGQIALVPGSMRLAGSGARGQCALALRHIARVLRAAHPRAHIRSVVQVTLYQRFTNIFFSTPISKFYTIDKDEFSTATFILDIVKTLISTIRLTAGVLWTTSDCNPASFSVRPDTTGFPSIRPDPTGLIKPR